MHLLSPITVPPSTESINSQAVAKRNQVHCDSYFQGDLKFRNTVDHSNLTKVVLLS